MNVSDFVALVLMTFLVITMGCETTPTEIPEPAGSLASVEGLATIKIGKTGTLILITDNQEELCLLDKKFGDFKDGARVAFNGKKQAILPVSGEHCMRFEPVAVTLSTTPAKP